MAGAIITAAIPGIKEHFGFLPNAELFSKLVITLPALFIAVIAPFAGKLIDKTGRKKVLLWSLLFYALGGTSGFYLSNIYLILLGRAILGVSVAGIMTINTTLIGDYFKGKARSKFMGWQGAFMGFGGVVFVSLGGILADVSYHWPFLVYGFSIVILFLAWQFLYEPEVIINKDHKLLMPQKKTKNKKFLLLYFTAFFGMLFFYLIPTQVPFLLGEAGILKSSTIGFSISAAVLAGAFISVIYGRIRSLLSFNQIFVATFVLMGSGYILTALSSGYWGILSGLIIAGFGTGLFMPNTNLWLITLAPSEKRGQMVGVLNFAVYCGQFLSPIIISPLVYYFSISFSFLICGLLMVVMAAYFYYLHYRKLKLNI